MNELVSQQWYESLIEECKSIITEAEFTSRWALVEGYWLLGQRIREDVELKKWEQNKAGRVLQDLAKDLSISERTIYYALQAFDKYPVLDKVPEGKAISWNKLITKYLPKQDKVLIANQTSITQLQEGKYDVIVIDPPWKIEKIQREVAPNQAGFDYSTMEIEEIKQITLPTAEDCHIFLWTTQKYLPIAFEVLEEWGLNYICCMTWSKVGGFQAWNLPQYNSEFVLYARRGFPKFIDTKDFMTSFHGKRREHSRKPDEFYNTIARVTRGNKLDMFSREKRDGWVSWGAEINKF
jgi:N6-adenosine-specific RNA methylase IME4